MNGSKTLSIWMFPSQFAPHVGGVERVVEDVAVDLAELGHKVTIVTNQFPATLPPEGVVAGLDVYRFAWPAPSRAPMDVLHALGRAPLVARGVRRIAAPRPDVIHVHCVSSQAPYAWWLARRTRARLIVTTHGEFTADANGLFQTSRWARWWAKRLIRDAARVTAPSRRVCDDAALAGLDLPADSAVIPNGLDVDAWATVLPRPATPTVGAWGRLSPEKGFDRLLAAWPRVIRARPDARLWIAGEGRDRACLEADLPARVELVNALDHTALRDRLAATRTVVVPSRSEAFGLVAAEALTAGRVLVYATGTAMDDLIGQAGIPADADDPEQLAAAILRSFDGDLDGHVPGFPSRRDMTVAYEAVYRSP